MTSEDVVAKYGHLVGFAAAKAYRKWYSYLTVTADQAAFQREDIWQYALEALMLLAGFMPGSRNALNGRLTEIEAQGGERFLQRTIDMYVAAYLAHEVEKSRAVKRGGRDIPESLEARQALEDDRGAGVDVKAVETAVDGSENHAGRFPILWATEIQHEPPAAVIALYGSREAYRMARCAEIEAFSLWARKNRRVTA